MTENVEWEALFAEYAVGRFVPRPENMPPRAFWLPTAAVERFIAPGEEDVRWLSQALRHHHRKWLVLQIVRRSPSLAEVFLAPMLDAGIDVVDPSVNRSFIEPCVRAFGHRRVIEYLLGVVESGTDFRRSGAVNALYWVKVGLRFIGIPPTFSVEYATPESRAAYQALMDLWERRDRLLLETFVSNPDLDVRRSIIASLSLEASDYPESHRPLVPRAIAIARGSADKYLRHRVEVQLGNVNTAAPLPHREEGDA